jgi:hypothetical protein
MEEEPAVASDIVTFALTGLGAEQPGLKAGAEFSVRADQVITVLAYDDGSVSLGVRLTAHDFTTFQVEGPVADVRYRLRFGDVGAEKWIASGRPTTSGTAAPVARGQRSLAPPIVPRPELQP